MSPKTSTAAAGDWLEVHGPGGGVPRRGQILEVIGGSQHERYRVRWTDDRESIFYPSEGTRFIAPAGRDHHRRARRTTDANRRVP